MTGLIRTQASGFTLGDCITLEQAQQFTADGTLEQQLRPVDTLFSHLPKIRLNEVQTEKFQNGVRLDLNRVRHKKVDTLHRVYGHTGLFLGLASLDHSDESLRIEKMFAPK